MALRAGYALRNSSQQTHLHHSFQPYCFSSILTFSNMSAHDHHKSSIEGHAMEKSSSANFDHVEKSHGTVVEFDDSIEDTKPSKSVWLITFTVAMGGFLFGG
jgi:hypothetical protein